MIVFISPFCSNQQLAKFFMSPVIDAVNHIRHDGHHMAEQLDALRDEFPDNMPPIIRTIAGYEGCTHILDDTGLFLAPDQTLPTPPNDTTGGMAA